MPNQMFLARGGITDRQRAEGAMRGSDARLRAALEELRCVRDPAN